MLQSCICRSRLVVFGSILGDLSGFSSSVLPGYPSISLLATNGARTQNRQNRWELTQTTLESWIRRLKQGKNFHLKSLISTVIFDHFALFTTVFPYKSLYFYCTYYSYLAWRICTQNSWYKIPMKTDCIKLTITCYLTVLSMMWVLQTRQYWIKLYF